MILFLVFGIPVAFSQDLSVKSTVIEEETGAPIPYASVYTLRNRRGTITDLNGAFELNELSESDTLVFYFAGFQKKMLAVVSVDSSVTLAPLEQLLDDIIVMADASVVYRLLSNTQKNVEQKNELAQTYFEIQSFQDNRQLEYFQGYYNGQYDGYDIDDLELKTARFGIKPTQSMAFLSQGTSKAMYKHTIFEANNLFPDSPFGLRKRKLVSNYSLTLNAKYREQNGDITYVISFAPKADSLTSFSGKAWIDSASNILTKVEFTAQNTRQFPFQAIHKGGQLRDVNLHITKTYDRTKKGVRLSSMDFKYDFTFDPKAVYDPYTLIVYKEAPDSAIQYRAVPTYSIRSEAFLAAYNYDREFYIPKFKFAYHEIGDYLRMKAFSSHDEFWRCYNKFRVGKSEANEAFLNDPKVLTQERFHQKNEVSDVGLFEYPYRTWSEKRIYFRKRIDSSLMEAEGNPFEGNSINARKYLLEAQISLEVDSLCDSLQYRTQTIFDPYTSFYHFERTPRSVAFLNVYFDLMEIYRRELVEKLDAAMPSEATWTRIYYDHLQEISWKVKAFFKEVDRGTNEEEFLKWNELVKKELGIDNNALFSDTE